MDNNVGNAEDFITYVLCDNFKLVSIVIFKTA